MRFTFTVPGEPEGKARPKVNTKTKTAYTPQKTRTYEAKIRGCYSLQGGGKYEGAVKVKVTAFFRIPKKYTKKERELIQAGKLLPTKKPDGDNIVKAVLDALNGLAYDDDKQVTSHEVMKRYAYGSRKTECLVITLEEDIPYGY